MGLVEVVQDIYKTAQTPSTPTESESGQFGHFESGQFWRFESGQSWRFESG